MRYGRTRIIVIYCKDDDSKIRYSGFLKNVEKQGAIVSEEESNGIIKIVTRNNNVYYLTATPLSLRVADVDMIQVEDAVKENYKFNSKTIYWHWKTNENYI